jgi:hypothetical protein
VPSISAPKRIAEDKSFPRREKGLVVTSIVESVGMTKRAENRPSRGRQPSLLSNTTGLQRTSRAKLVLDLDELARAEWSTLMDYRATRRIASLAAARRSLFRVKRLLAEKGVGLEVTQYKYALSARFGCRAVRELIELDVRPAAQLLERLDAEREGREPCLPPEQLLLAPETIAVDYRDRSKTFGWIAEKHGIGKGRLRRLLAATGPIPDRALRLCVEEREARHVVDRAIEAAKRGALVSEIAAILCCCDRTARRFLRRHEVYARRGRPRTSGRPRTW